MFSRTKFNGIQRLVSTIAALALAATVSGQAPAPGLVPAGALRVTSRLVLVDVVAVDKQGHLVSDLEKGDFVVEENGKPQKISAFSLERANSATAAAPPMPLPPNIFTNRPEYRTPPGPLILLMLDSLNTPQSNQAYARQQMLKYLDKSLEPNQGAAILALGSSLHLLQDFTSDPRLLRAAIQKYTTGKSVLLTEASDASDLSQLERLPQTLMVQATLAQLQSFEQDQIAMQTEMRVRITLDALRSIARTAAGFPGRKVLIWVSAAFPLSLEPNQFTQGAMSHAFGLGLSQFYEADVQRTASLLADAQVAIYPVDARGLASLDMTSASSPSTSSPAAIFGQTNELVDSRLTMELLAEETGGRAFFSRNDIDQAVALAASEGTTYYELGYYPEGQTWDGKFHKINVKVAREGVQLRHRRGYFAMDPAKWKETDQKPDQDISAALMEPIPATQVTFMARVIPQPAGTQQHVDIQFGAYANTISFEEEPGGTRHASVNFLAVAVTPDGKSAAQDSKTIDTHLKPETYARVQKDGLPFHMELMVPPGNYQLHLGVFDNRTGWIGTTTVPLLLEAPKPAEKKP